MRKTSNCGAKFHPMLIKFCLSMSQKSVSSYDELRNTFGDVIKLPSRRTLRDYRNWIHPTIGFDKKIVDELIRLTDRYFDVGLLLC